MRKLLFITILAAHTVALGLVANADAKALPKGGIELVMGLDYPEGIALDKKGNIFVSLPRLGEVWRISPKGEQTVLCSGLPEALGLAVDAPGNVYVAVGSIDPGLRGVYRIGRDGSSCELFPGTERMIYPDGLAFDKRGNLYATDAAEGAIYRIHRRGGPAHVWLQHELLSGSGVFGFPTPIGANGIQYWKNSLLVANSEQYTIVRIPILPDGSPGEPEVFYQAAYLPVPNTPFRIPLEFVPDGIALDVLGNIYIADPAYSQLYLVPADGSQGTPLATYETELDNPTSLAFGTGKGERENLFIANYDLIDAAGEAGVGFPVNNQPHDGPALLKMGTGIPGRPLP
jgi:sugar lactone lactonase YvrE